MAGSVARAGDDDGDAPRDEREEEENQVLLQQFYEFQSGDGTDEGDDGGEGGGAARAAGTPRGRHAAAVGGQETPRSPRVVRDDRKRVAHAAVVDAAALLFASRNRARNAADDERNFGSADVGAERGHDGQRRARRREL